MVRKTVLASLVYGVFVWAPFAVAMDIIIAITPQPTQLHGATTERFANLLQQKLGSEYTVKFYHSSQLGKDKELMQKLKLGTVHFSLPSSIMASIVPEFAVFDMPFIIKDRSHVQRVEQHIFWQKLAPKAEAKGYKIIALWENGIRHISNSKRPVYTPADLKGLKIRTPKSTWRVAMFSEWGASPTPMAFSEVFVGLQTGVIDGQENPLGTIWGAKLYEVQSHVSLTGHVYIPAYLTTSVKVWNSLPAEVRQAALEASTEVRAKMYADGAKGDRELVGALKTAGVSVNTANRQSFVDASAPIYKKFKTEVPDGATLVNGFLKLAE